MPIPSSIADLSTTASANSPAGAESPGLIDDYLRTYASYIAQLRDRAGRLINVQIFTANSTYTPTAGTTSVVVEVQAAGGSGAGAAAVGTAGFVSAGNGGGAGGYARSRFTSGFSGASVSVGAGGASSSATGNPGGTSSFGASISATGGAGGALVNGTNAFPVTQTPAACGIGSGGNIENDSGIFGIQMLLCSANNASSGGGGSSKFGGGGSPATGIGAGNSALTYGAGGGGAIVQNVGIAQGSGSGKNGVVIVWEYA